jgi:myo-inositol-1(or 4)-monophosphatase
MKSPGWKKCGLPMLNNELLAKEIEVTAIQLARGAGEILASHFGRQISVEYKDKEQRDPVTAADKTTQEYLVGEINRQFPDHGILGEEDSAKSDSQAPDYLWVLDPLDGTTNFLNGLPIYASSIGVLYRGWPLVGALFVPWPKTDGGFVLHCRRGGGCFADAKPVSVYQSDEPVSNRLTGFPVSFTTYTKFGRKLRNPFGEMRTTGSIAYELAMTACGVMQYTVFYAPHMWDMAAGALAVLEANGMVMTKFSRDKRWHLLESLVPTWEDKPPSQKDLRRWTAPLVAGNQQVAPLIANNIHRRFRLCAQVRRLTRRLRPSHS